MDTNWLLLQLSDSAFPTGGFAHSSGLEAAWQQGELASPSALRRFIVSWCWQAGCGALPVVNEAHASPGRHAALDAQMESFLVSHVARRASRTQGRAFFDTCARIFPAVAPLQARARDDGLLLHHAPVFGVVLRALDVALDETQQLFLSLGLRGVLSAAVRLGAIGTHEAQRLQSELAPELSRVLAHAAPLRAEDLAQTAPLIDLFGATHDRLYSRLFQS